MKKVLFGLFALSCVSMAAETNLYFRAGADLNGKFDTSTYEDVKINKEDADDFSWEIAVEATKEIYPNLELGLGLAYQKHGDPKANNDWVILEVENDVDALYDAKFEMPGYTSIPLYLVAKYNFNAVNNFVPYVKAVLGYSFNDEDGDFKLSSDKDGVNIDNPTDFYEGGSVKGDVKIENGLYYGFGAGFEYNNFTIDLMYQVNEAEAEITIDEFDTKAKKDYDYDRVTLSFGYKFNLAF